MPDLVTTIGSATANSFVTEDEADTYLDARLNASAWNDEDDDDQKLRALIEATRQLTLLVYAGERASGTQALAWPRVYAPNTDAPTTLVDPSTYIPIGPAMIVYYDNDEIPQRIKDATCELALEFLKAGTTDIAAEDTKQNVISKTIGSISTTYAAPTQRTRGIAKYPRVLDLIAPLLDQSSTGGLTMVRC